MHVNKCLFINLAPYILTFYNCTCRFDMASLLGCHATASDTLQLQVHTAATFVCNVLKPFCLVANHWSELPLKHSQLKLGHFYTSPSYYLSSLVVLHFIWEMASLSTRYATRQACVGNVIVCYVPRG